MKQFVPRWIQGRIEQALKALPVVVAGSRQAGNFTLVRHVQPKRRYRPV